MKKRLIPHPSDEFERQVFTDAIYFNVVTFEGCGQYRKRTFSTFAEAIAEANTDPRAMVYAVRADNRFAMLGRGQWPELLKLKS